MTNNLRFTRAFSNALKFTGALIIALFVIASAPASADAPARIKIEFMHPEKFTDARHDEIASAAQQNFLLEALAQHIVRRVAPRLPAAAALAVTVTNVDMAGRFEPLRNATFKDSRTIRNVYPPRIDLEFRLTDEDGQLIKEGRRGLRNFNFLATIHRQPQDLLKHEKALLDDWIDRDFPPVRQS